jgi:hypothetical protein
MRFRRSSKTPPFVVLAPLAALLAVSVPPCWGAPPPLDAERSAAAAARTTAAAPAPRAAIPAAAGSRRARRGDSSAAGPAAPTFQVIGTFGDMAVVSPTNLLTAAVFAKPDAAFGGAFVTGLAASPAGTLFIVGNDGTSNSFLGQVNFTTGAETTVGKIAGYVINDIAFDGAGRLYGLTDNTAGTSPHSLLLIDTVTAAAAVVKVLDAHGGPKDQTENGAIAFNPGDGNFYYADVNASGALFVDRLAAGTFMQTPVLTSNRTDFPTAMVFSQGKLWIFAFVNVLVADAANIAAGLAFAGNPVFPTPDGLSAFFTDGAVANGLPCVPSPTAACLYNRFKVEITYDATPNNGTGPANVVLESTASVKFTFFDRTNIEMILKILNACSLNNKWWVFAGGLTDVGVSIKVTDTSTGAFQNYSSAKGHLFQTFADTSAFNCP